MRIGVVGLGFMGSTHARALLQVPGAELSAVVSSDPLKLSGDFTGVAGNLGGPTDKLDFSRVRKYSDFAAALKDPDLDALDICLPSDQHLSAVRAALGAGKHVLCEKPLALDGNTADLLVEEAKRAGRILMAGHVLRFFSEYQALAGMVKGGRLGAWRGGVFRRRCGAPSWSRWLTDSARSGGAVLDLLIHDIDFCLYLFGKPRFISAVGYVDLDRGIDWLDGRLRFDAGNTAIVSGGWHHPKSYPFRMEYTVVSDGGTLEFRSGDLPLTLFDSTGSSEKVDAPEVDAFVRELTYFAACARENRQPEMCPPEESAMAVKVARLLMESRARNGEEIPCRF